MSKKALHDKIISDIAALTLPGGGLAFNDVGKVFYNNLTPGKAEVGVETSTSQIDGVSYNTRVYSFTIMTVENFDNAASEAALENKIDRLSYIEDAIFDYLDELPAGKSSNLDGAVAGMEIYRIEIQPAVYTELTYEAGVSKWLEIKFRVFVLIQPRNL